MSIIAKSDPIPHSYFSETYGSAAAREILAVGRGLNATASVVDASGLIVMPGFVDTHHHQYETILRGILADGVLGSPNDGKRTYQGVIQGIFTPVYQPEGAYISE
jgi:5-methylthioadenosine/S-adenosylhomocysteine deaminase